MVAKLSGLVAEADWATWTVDDLRPVRGDRARAVRAGPADVRLGLAGVRAGRDVRAGRRRRWTTILGGRPADIFGGTAVRTYELEIAMRYLRVGPAGAETPGAATPDGAYFDLSGVTRDIDGAFLAAGGFTGDVGRPAADRHHRPADRCSDRPTRRGAVHRAELRRARRRVRRRRRRTQPIMFYKAPNTVVGPHDDIAHPARFGEDRLGGRARRGDRPDRALPATRPSEALACVAGYVLSNDVSERDYQLAVSGGQWSKGKSCETFNPLGPVAGHAGRGRSCRRCGCGPGSTASRGRTPAPRT